MTMPLHEVIKAGGCYWRRQNRFSPVHSVAIAAGTPFKIALDGANSRNYANGICESGYFVLSGGKFSGKRFITASKAVSAVREPSTNAFLYVESLIDDQSIKADKLRQRDDTRLDPAEEVAMQDAIKLIGGSKAAKDLDAPTITRYAAAYVAQNPDLIEEARKSPLALQLVCRGA